MKIFIAMFALAVAGAAAYAADAAKPISTAAAHAGMAAGASSAPLVQAHLQHVINCLEGPSGADFNAGPGNPCQDLGEGAIPASAPDKREALKAVVAKAKLAMKETDIVKAKVMAAEIQADLAK
ncbi:MAG TPA: hypothetical protein VMU17_01880 [Elusimicrobiota bacterium]|nr:hypothetical protein [Elusimicrobiota bacterium]